MMSKCKKVQTMKCENMVVNMFLKKTVVIAVYIRISETRRRKEIRKKTDLTTIINQKADIYNIKRNRTELLTESKTNG